MKSRFFSISIPLVFILIIAPLMLHTSGNGSEAVLYKAFAESGAEMVSTEITISGVSAKGFQDDYDREEFIAEIAEALGHNLPLKAERVENESFTGFEINNSTGSNIRYNLKLLQSKEKEEQGINYVTLYLVDTSPAPACMEIKPKAERIFRKYGIRPSVNTCFTGRYDGRLDNSRIDDITEGILKRASARKVSGIRDNNLLSVCAYSRAIRDSVSVDGKDVNIGFAARYNSYEEKTYIWLATPLITTEY